MIETLGKYLSGYFTSSAGKPWFEKAGDAQLFEARRLEVSVWCSTRIRAGDPKNSLRTELLRPSLIVDESWNYEITDRSGEVTRLCESRSALLANTSTENESTTGALLLFWPDETLWDGAAEQESAGFFDTYNIPPWDTWFWYGPLIDEPPALVSWVPSVFLSLVAKGISANPEQCLRLLKAA